MSRTVVLQVAWRYSRGGGKTQVARDLLELHDRGTVEMHAFSMRPLYDEDGLDELGEDIRFHSAGVHGVAGRRGALRGVPELRRVVRRVRPDVVHLHAGWDWWIVPSLLGRRRPAIVLEIHDPPGTGKATTKHGRFLRWLVRRAGATPLTHSTWNRAQTAAWLDRPAADVRCIPLGIHLPVEAPAPEARQAARARLDLPPEESVVSYVTRLVPTKQPLLFVEVARHVLAAHDGVRFVLAGDGPLADAVRDASADLGDRFRQLGYVESVDDVLAASDLFCSTSSYEGFGLAVAEAMARRVPAVAAAVGGLEDVVGDAGILVPDADPDALVRAVLDLLERPDRRSALAAASEARVRSAFDVRTFVEATQRLWLEAAR